MFETLSARLNDVFNQLRRRGKLTEADVDSALREVRLALLEADVHFGVVKNLIARVRERAVGVEVSRAMNPAQQVVQIVHQELIATLGEAAPLNLSGPRPRVIMLVGLQGSGKTTAAAKLARILRSSGERVMLVAADPYRPAAIEQLQQLGARLDVPVEADAGLKPCVLAQRALQKAQKGGFGVMILDTAGRSQLDTGLMEELRDVASAASPVETLLVLDSMIGQEALNIAQGFREHVSITGLILTKMDGDARGGAAISVRSVTGIPIKFVGTGEKLDALETYDPARLSSRILGMGDMIGLIERAQTALSTESARVQAERLSKGQFTLDDWLAQMRQLKQMGSMSQIMDMLPGQLGQAARQADPSALEKGLRQSEAIVRSMTKHERLMPDILNASRRRRIAAGSGTDVRDVNRMLKQFREAQKLIKIMQKDGGRSISKILH
jgi:signal recognition particle subunit SRP54